MSFLFTQTPTPPQPSSITPPQETKSPELTTVAKLQSFANRGPSRNNKVASKNRRSSRRGRKGGVRDPKQQVAEYAFVSSQMMKPVSRKIALKHFVQIASNGSGVFADAIGSDPSICTKFADFAAIYPTYRVRSMRVQFQPSNKYDLAASSFASPIAVVAEMQSGVPAVPTSYASVEDYESLLFGNTGDQFSFGVNTPNAPPYTDLNLTAVPANTFYIKFYSNLLGASQVLGDLLVTFNCEFYGLF
jgi:hypothetical protein